MTTVETIKARRSVRKFTDESIPQDNIDVLKDAILRSPTSRNRKSWRFWFVSDRKLLEELAEAKSSGSQLILGAKLAVVIGGNKDESDCWIEDCSIAATILQLAAQSLGLTSCWVQIRERMRQTETSENFVRKLLNIEENIRIECVVALGYAAESPKVLKAEDLDYQKIVDL